MKTLLEIDAEQAEGAIARGHRNARYGISVTGMLQQLPRQIQTLTANPLGGRTTEPFSERVLQRTPRIVTAGLQKRKIQWMIEIGFNIINQFIESIPTLALPLPQPIVRSFLAQFRNQHGRQQPVNLIIKLQPLR